MIYKKYLRCLNGNFSVLDGVKCESTLFLLYFKHLGLFMIEFTFLFSIFVAGVGGCFSHDPDNDIVIVGLSFAAGAAIPFWLNRRDKKKWMAMIGVYKEMQHQRCLELRLPLVLRRERVASGSHTTRTRYYATFLMPALFEEEFLHFRKNDTCRELVFDWVQENEWVRANMKECRVTEIPKANVGMYTFRGMKPISLIPPER